MANVSIGNTDSGISGKTVALIGSANSGDLLFTDAAYDIGKSGATRARDLFLSRNAVIGGNLSVGGTLGVTGATTLGAAVAVSAGQVTIPSGTVGAPALGVGDTDVGLYSSGADALELATAGVKALGIDSTQFIDSPTQPRCLATNSTALTVTAGNTTALTLDSETFDVGAMHSTAVNTSRITIPTGGD